MKFFTQTTLPCSLSEIKQQFEKSLALIESHWLNNKSVSYGISTFIFVRSRRDENLIHERYDDDVHFIKIKNNQYYFGYMERGQETNVHYSNCPEDVLYWALKSIVSGVGSEFYKEYKRDIDTNKFDFARFYYAKQLELLRKINPAFETKCRADLLNRMTEHPFRDEYPQTLEYINEYLAAHPMPMPRIPSP